MINFLMETARLAGGIIRNGFDEIHDIQFKSTDINLVTEIDKASEKLIVESIQKKYPGHGILAEEGTGELTSSEYLWVVDPLDGTTNFAHKLPIFSVSIGVQKNNEIIAGVIYDVMQDIMYSCEKGSGAFANQNKITVSKSDKLLQSLLVTGFPYNIGDNPEGTLEKFSALTRLARGVRRLGSAAVDLAYVSAGVFEGYWESYLHPWDMCAGILLVEEAGGKVTNFKGENIDIYSKQILATNSLIHEDMMGVLLTN